MFPTWEEGGLTSKGYGGVLAERMGELLGIGLRVVRKPGHSPLLDSVRRFVGLYFRHSWIDPGWKPLFQGVSTAFNRSCNDKSAICTPQDTILIATDHYAECTPTLCRLLHGWGIQGRPILGQTHSPPPLLGERGSIFSRTKPPVFIANSADLGAWKKDPSFWVKINGKLPLQSFQRILLIDDFGYNEQRGDPYADRKRVEERRSSLLRCLRSFGAPEIGVFPFFLESSVTDAPLADLYEEYRRLVDNALLFLRETR